MHHVGECLGEPLCRLSLWLSALGLVALLVAAGLLWLALYISLGRCRRLCRRRPANLAVPVTIAPEHAALDKIVPASHRAAVDAFHREALAAGGTDNGAPGLRPHYHPNYYAAFVLDPDGHRIEAVCHGAA